MSKPRTNFIPINDRQLPFKLTAQSKSVQKAYANFLSEYGLTAGRRIFLAKASEQGTGNTLRQKVDSVYTKGRRIKQEGS